MAKRQEGQSTREEVLRDLVDGVRKGRSVVPLVGAGISVEAGVPPLFEVTRYLAKTKAYLRHRVFTSQPQRNPSPPVAAYLQGKVPLPPIRRMQPRDYLREFGWPDPHELNSSLWHWLWSHPPRLRHFTESLDMLVNGEILDSLERIDQGLASGIWELTRKARDTQARGERRLRGSYWKILLTQLTRSSPDLVDTLFQRLTYNREPATAHRYFAFLAPVLRLRLFLTINFDTLLEDALRIEGFRPTVYEVAEGLSLPHPKLVQEGLSIVKLHGGAYGLLVGDKLDSPLDEETKARFLSYLPEHLILLVMGIGGWDQRVLDMVALAGERQGLVLWLHFEPDPPPPLKARFAERVKGAEEGVLPDWLKAVQIQDPGAFLRELYGEFKHFHPSSSQPIQVSDLRPVLIDPPPEKTAVAVLQGYGGRLVIYEDEEEDFGLGAAQCLARFVAEKSKTHQPVWVDLETKFTVEDILVDLIQQLRRYDPNLPPEILVMESVATSRGAKLDFRKVVRRLYAALARGRYVLAFNGVKSFGRRPTRHHAYEEDREQRSTREAEAYRDLWKLLIKWIEPMPGGGEKQPESLGLLDSILAFAIDFPEEDRAEVGDLFRQWGRPTTKAGEGWVEGGKRLEKGHFDALGKEDWDRHPVLILLTAMRRRRSLVALQRLVPKYLQLEASSGGPDPQKTVEEKLKELTSGGYLSRLEGGDYWMSRKLRNRFYDRIRSATKAEDESLRIRGRSALAFVHQDLAEYHHRDLYVGSQEITSLLEELYHRISSLRHLWKLQELAESSPILDRDLEKWIEALTCSVSRLEPSLEAIQDPWSSPKITADGVLVKEALVQRRFRGLRVLREVLEQEKEALLSRVPSATLEGWLEEIRKDLEEIACGSPDQQSLQELLEDIQVEVLQDRMKSLEIVKLRREGLLRLAGLVGLAAAEPEPGSELVWPLPDGNQEHEPTLGQLRELCGRDELAEHEIWERRYRVGKALADVARALHWSPWDLRRKQVRADDFERALVRLIDENWQPASDEPVHPRFLFLKTIQLRLQADQALWGQSPWETKGKGHSALEVQREAARTALGASEKALLIFDGIRDDNRTDRSYLYSLKGRALYLLSSSLNDFDNAYREFDLARAGLSEATASEREALSVTLLRQAECLMVHSDDFLASWVLDLVKDRVLLREEEIFPWKSLLSSEGRKRLSLLKANRNQGEAAQIETLLRLSLANSSPDVLRVLEHCVRGIEECRIELNDTLGTMRTRLATARDLLIRVESLLAHSRRKVEWWACLFQLRSQLAVERLLLLLSGDLPFGPETGRPEPWITSAHNKEDLWDEVGSWLKNRGPKNYWCPPGWEGRLETSGVFLTKDSDFQRFFIHRFQGLLRQGLMAVRQGLDILLPDDQDREKERLEKDVLLNRLLRTWTELMICGVYATNMSTNPQRIKEDRLRQEIQTQENRERWDQWRHLNWLSGLVTLPGCVEIRSWFVSQDWTIASPSLFARATALARMDLCLSNEKNPRRANYSVGLGLMGGNAIESLHQTLGPGSDRPAASTGQPRQRPKRSASPPK
jgi:hypothetical protein